MAEVSRVALSITYRCQDYGMGCKHADYKTTLWVGVNYDFEKEMKSCIFYNMGYCNSSPAREEALLQEINKLKEENSPTKDVMKDIKLPEVHNGY